MLPLLAKLDPTMNLERRVKYLIKGLPTQLAVKVYDQRPKSDIEVRDILLHHEKFNAIFADKDNRKEFDGLSRGGSPLGTQLWTRPVFQESRSQGPGGQTGYSQVMGPMTQRLNQLQLESQRNFEEFRFPSYGRGRPWRGNPYRGRGNGEPFQRVFFDVCGPLVPSKPNQHQFCMVAVDSLTRFVITGSARSYTAINVAKFFLNSVIFVHGCPEVIL